MQDHFGPARELIARAPYRVGVLARSADGETLLEHDADRAAPAASVIKVPLVMALYADGADGLLDLGERVGVGERVDGSGVLRDMPDVDALSLRDLAALMMTLSDNTATNRIIERIGVERVEARSTEWGIATTLLRRKMYDFERSMVVGEVTCASRRGRHRRRGRRPPGQRCRPLGRSRVLILLVSLGSLS